MAWIAILVTAGLSLAGGALVWHRRTRSRRAARAMGRRLETRYGPADTPAEAVALRSPQGRVAVSPDGVLVSLEGDAFRCVGWGDVGEMWNTGGSVVLHISRVGNIAVPRVLGRKIWDAVSARAAARV